MKIGLVEGNLESYFRTIPYTTGVIGNKIKTLWKGLPRLPALTVTFGWGLYQALSNVEKNRPPPYIIGKPLKITNIFKNGFRKIIVNCKHQ
jgi:hypothetical protein